MTIRARMRAAVVVDETTGCHVWTRARNNRGYGVTWFDGKLRLAHRVAWYLAHGDWPNPELVLDHMCNRKACVNPDHLRELTNSANLMRAIPRGDAATERRRAAARAATARYRARLKGREA